MDQSPRPISPADELIVRLYRRLLAFLGGIGLFLAAIQVVPPTAAAWLAGALPLAILAAVCLWARDALTRPRPAAYWATVVGFGGVVAVIAVTSLLRGDLLTPLFTAFVWSGPLRALALPRVRRALSGDDDRRGGLRRRLREARDRLAALLRPRLQPAPVPVS